MPEKYQWKNEITLAFCQNSLHRIRNPEIFFPQKSPPSQIPRLAKSPVRTYMITSSYTLGVETKLLQSFK